MYSNATVSSPNRVSAYDRPKRTGAARKTEDSFENFGCPAKIQSLMLKYQRFVILTGRFFRKTGGLLAFRPKTKNTKRQHYKGAQGGASGEQKDNTKRRQKDPFICGREKDCRIYLLIFSSSPGKYFGKRQTGRGRILPVIPFFSFFAEPHPRPSVF